MALHGEQNEVRRGGDPSAPASREGSPDGSSSSPGADGPRRSWRELVEGIQRGDDAAMEALYASFTHGVRYYFCKHLGAVDLDDHVHDAYLTVVQAIRTGSLREPEALMGFVKTIIRRQVAAGIDSAIQSRRQRADFEVSALVLDDRQSPEQEAIGRQKTELMVQVLQEISPRDREILTRFYLYGQSQDQICREMQLTGTQFRLLKSRAKARFGELGRKRLLDAETGVELRRMAGA